MNTTETKVKLVKGNSIIYATLRKGEFRRFTKDGETVCDGEFQKLGGAPETRHGDYAAMKRLFHEFVGVKCVDGYTVEGSAAAALGRMGGASTSPAKQAASRANGAKGGRPATLHDARSERGECYFWRHIVRRTAKRIIISDYTNVQGGSDYDVHYPRSAEFDAAIDAWVARLNADESEWSEWSDQPVRDYYTQEPTPFFGVAPCKIVEREIR